MKSDLASSKSHTALTRVLHKCSRSKLWSLVCSSLHSELCTYRPRPRSCRSWPPVGPTRRTLGPAGNGYAIFWASSTRKGAFYAVLIDGSSNTWSCCSLPLLQCCRIWSPIWLACSGCALRKCAWFFQGTLRSSERWRMRREEPIRLECGAPDYSL